MRRVAWAFVGLTTFGVLPGCLFFEECGDVESPSAASLEGAYLQAERQEIEWPDGLERENARLEYDGARVVVSYTRDGVAIVETWTVTRVDERF